MPVQIARPRHTASCLSFCAAFMSAGAYAGEADIDASPLEEIVVTAQKRSENLQDVPIAITAISAGKLEKSGIVNSYDLTQAVPGLVIFQGVTITRPFLRGVGNLTSSPGVEGAVALYIDGVYVPSKTAGAFELNNIERIEVLKGPQGTLFGRNATGGAVLITTKAPTKEFKADARIFAGSFHEVGGDAFVAGPLGDTLSAAISGRYSQNDGYARDILTGKRAGATETYSGMAKLRWQPNDGTDILLTGDYTWYSDASGGSVQPAPGSDSTGTGAFSYQPRRVAGLNPDPESTNEQYGLALRAQFDLGVADLVSITGYREVNSLLNFDTDGTSALTTSFINEEYSRNASQELQLISNGDGPFKWIAGLYYIRDRGGYRPLDIGQGVRAPYSDTQLLAGGIRIRVRAQQRTEAYAAFVQGSYALPTGTTITAGLRYNDEKKSLRGTQVLNRAVAGVITTTPLANNPGVSQKFDDVTWRLAIDQKLGDRAMIYASWNRGFKSGAYNTTAPGILRAVDPERLDAYEAGFKSETADRRMRLNGAFFYYDYSNLQQQRIDATTSAVTLENAAEAEMYGFDLEFSAAPSDRLTVEAGMNYLHSKYTSYPNAAVFIPNPAGGNFQRRADLSGNQLVFAPKYTVNVSADWRVPTSFGTIALNGSLYYTDSYPIEPLGRVTQKSYTLVNAGISWTSPNEHVEIALKGRNLTDAVYQRSFTVSAQGDVLAYSPPASWMVSARYRY